MINLTIGNHSLFRSNRFWFIPQWWSCKLNSRNEHYYSEESFSWCIQWRAFAKVLLSDWMWCLRNSIITNKTSSCFPIYVEESMHYAFMHLFHLIKQSSFLLIRMILPYHNFGKLMSDIVNTKAVGNIGNESLLMIMKS